MKKKKHIKQLMIMLNIEIILYMRRCDYSNSVKELKPTGKLRNV